MSRVTVNEQYLQDTANAIRAKTGEIGTYKPSQFASAINDISSSGSSGWTDITSSCVVNTYDMTINEDIAGYILYAYLNLSIEQNSQNVLACFFVNNSNQIVGEASSETYLLSVGGTSSYSSNDSYIAFYNWITDSQDPISINDLFWVKKTPLPT